MTKHVIQPIILDRRTAQRMVEYFLAMYNTHPRRSFHAYEAYYGVLSLGAALSGGFVDYERRTRDVPSGFAQRRFYTDMVDQFVLDVYGGEPDGLESLSVMLARHAAKSVDDWQQSTDFRLEELESLTYLLDSIRRRNAPDPDRSTTQC